MSRAAEAGPREAPTGPVLVPRAGEKTSVGSDAPGTPPKAEGADEWRRAVAPRACASSMPGLAQPSADRGEQGGPPEPHSAAQVAGEPGAARQVPG